MEEKGRVALDAKDFEMTGLGGEFKLTNFGSQSHASSFLQEPATSLICRCIVLRDTAIGLPLQVLAVSLAS